MWNLLQISFGTASLVALVYALWPNIRHHNVRYRRQAWIAAASFLILTVGFYLWAPDTRTTALNHQTDTLEISDRNDAVFEVFYPAPYKMPPTLKVRFIKGRGTIEFVEQRADGFRFKTRDVGYMVGEGAHVEWSATGRPAK